METATNHEDIFDWQKWLNLDVKKESNAFDDDFGLSRIAKYFGKVEALRIYWEGTAKESEGDVDGAISSYKCAFRMWPALDSITQGGLPRGVREQVLAAGICQRLGIRLLDAIEISTARASSVIKAYSLLSPSELESIESVRRSVMMDNNEYSLVNNPQNVTHKFKAATFLNNPPLYAMCKQAPGILGKLIRFAMRAWDEGDWSGTSDSPGPLRAVTGGVPSLSIRVIEHWEYSVGGSLIDPYHYDIDSIVTIVVLLSDDFEGGVFRTYESDGSHLEHPMQEGDSICFVSHKYHNITPITRGIRKSLVIELWQGGCGHMGR
jgi:hypothetical protein